MRCLVTGGAGFIGSHVAEACLAAGHQVTIVDNLVRGSRANLPRAARFVKADIGSKRAFDLVVAERPEVIFHFAAQIDVRRSVADPAYDVKVNVLGSLNLMEAGRQAGLKRIVFSSTGGAIYGEQDVYPCDETHRCDPVSPYGASKLAVEKYLGFYRAQYGIEVVNLRYANVYGPRQDPHGEAGVVAIFARRLIEGKSCTIFGDGKQTRDYVYVADVAAANMAALTAPSGCYNIGTGVETDVNGLYARLAKAAGVTRPPEYAPVKPGEQRR
ncbi:MAG: NAD-dependent epimerase/dehydratase family protein, partial [Phycisphaerae bacterium]|nr:NAD-dependent epimerase/dehydratase family protein [Phycisphaerae bacterium]